MTQRPYVVLVLSGGGARAAYQVGVYEALAERGVRVDLVCGVSSGALNAAVIAGNPADERVGRLQAMWRSFRTSVDPGALLPEPWATMGRLALGGASGIGRRGIYRLRAVPPFLAAPGTPDATSLYSFDPLRATLAEYVDWDVVARGATRMAVGAVDVEDGRLTFFDSADEVVGPEHVVASGAMPPGAAPVRIGDRLYWDGSLAGELALGPVLERVLRRRETSRGIVALVVDPGSGPARAPTTLLDAATRRSEITHAARVRSALQLFFARSWAGATRGSADPFVPSAGGGSVEAGEAIGVVHLCAAEGTDPGLLGPFDFTPSALERRMARGREHTAAALRATPVDFDLFGDDPRPDMFVHVVRDGEVVDSRRRPLDGTDADDHPDGATGDDPTELIEAISLRMPALTDEDIGGDPTEDTSSWTSIRAIRLEKE